MADILILSGAGVSAESGLSTFRDNNGLWENHNVMEVCSVEGYMSNREKVLNFYDLRRSDLKDKKPNKMHKLIVKLANEYPKKISVITQNVDDLFEKAGSKNIIHLHGYLKEIVCENCGLIKDIGYENIKNHITCDRCKTKSMRHNVVMFGEAAPFYQDLYNAVDKCNLLVVIGTSGTVIPVEHFARHTKYSILNNLEESVDINDRFFTKVYYSKTTEAAEKIEKDIRTFIEKGYI
ncbi:MAG: NAD-dependent deacetylase [Candidatus Cloacimonadota bacterium]|nr:MAG: NAD-dependent deacetylase [Candidatus Cloacimonadota bacterium]PIE80068.1 MAG: NAD-dependent deacetylase [Candidatus Delongbacteria bacterium]